MATSLTGSLASNGSPVIYVILPVHNRIKLTKAFVQCLLSQTYQNYHLILVDDGCEDGTPEYVRTAVANLTILRGNGNLWWAGSLHKAYKHLMKLSPPNRDIVYITNDDTSFDSDYFEKLISDPELDEGSLVVSPGHSTTSDFVEYGFKIDWDDLRVQKLAENESPDAITTRGLYMHFGTLKAVGGYPYLLLPHYLSDLEYTIRARRKGYKLAISKATFIRVDRSTTGVHQATYPGFFRFLHGNLISKKTTFNATHWTWFALLAAPHGRKLHCASLVIRRFIKRTFNFVMR